MATRPVFYPLNSPNMKNVSTLVCKRDIAFIWHPGLSKTQKQKSVMSLHESAKKELLISNPLEVSTKSENSLGVALSAFNLKAKASTGDFFYSIESAFQASKIFENGGPYTEIIQFSSLDAKRDLRLKESGKMIGFIFDNIKWDADNTTAFYDWLYISALYKNKHLCEEVLKYDAFTDIEFNPEKSINCQAHSVALFVALSKINAIEHCISSKEIFLKMYMNKKVTQGSLF